MSRESPRSRSTDDAERFRDTNEKVSTLPSPFRRLSCRIDAMPNLCRSGESERVRRRGRRRSIRIGFFSFLSFLFSPEGESNSRVCTPFAHDRVRVYMNAYDFNLFLGAYRERVHHADLHIDHARRKISPAQRASRAISRRYILSDTPRGGENKHRNFHRPTSRSRTALSFLSALDNFTPRLPQSLSPGLQ